jgi:hypothetical protein
MSSTRRALALAFLLGLVVTSTGCIDQFGSLDRLDTSTLFQGAALQTGMEVAVTGGRVLMGAFLLIQLFVCWLAFMRGESWLDTAAQTLLGLLVCSWVLGTSNGLKLAPPPPPGASVQGFTCDPDDSSLQATVYMAGQCLGTLYASGNRSQDGETIVVASFAQSLKDLADAANDLRVFIPASDVQVFDAVVAVATTGGAVATIVANGALRNAIKMAMYVSYLTLIVIYSLLAPWVAPFAILRQTRGVFWGWLRSFAAVALWPFFMGLLDCMARELPWKNWIGDIPLSTSLLTMVRTGGFEALLMHLGRAAIMVVVLNLTFLAMYIAIPVVARKIVAGTGDAIRGGLF